MKKTGKNKKQNQKKQKAKQQKGFRDVLKRLFSHKLDKPSSTMDGELWMKIDR